MNHITGKKSFAQVRDNMKVSLLDLLMLEHVKLSFEIF